MTSDAASSRSPITASDIFQCRQCGECCRGFGGTIVGERDIQAISDFIGTSPDDFIKVYCATSGSGRVIAQGEDEYCIFTRDGLCGIHPVKPRMCRVWPFIESVLKSPGNWFIMAGACPGMRTDVSESDVYECVKAAMTAAGEIESGK